MEYIQRFVEKPLHEALTDTPVVVIAGPRQSGKSTLAQHIANDQWTYLTLDDENVLNAALDDPIGLLKQTPGRLIIDEVQRAPELLRSVKLAVDENREPGRYLITGSADILSIPRASESLAGRAEIIPLYPFSQAELLGATPGFVPLAFNGKLTEPATELGYDQITSLILQGGFPEVGQRKTLRRQQQWCRAYLDAVVQRDITDITDIRKANEMPQLLAALAAYSGQLLNHHDIGLKIRLDSKTVNNYITALEQLFLVKRLPAWHNNAMKRLIKKPKLHFSDSALLATLMEANVDVLSKDRTALGPLLETFVYTELQKQISWQNNRIQLAHYRDKDKVEVDFVLQNTQSELVAIEVKAASTVNRQDFSGIRRLATAAEDKFCLGVVLYTGNQILSFGERQMAAPLSCLWS